METVDEVEAALRRRLHLGHLRDNYIRLALIQRVELEIVPPDTGIYLRYTSHNEDWPYIHVWRMVINWRLVEADEYGFPIGRFWCFAGTGNGTFMRVMSTLAVWQGNPRSEPSGWIKSWDGRTDGIARDVVERLG